MLNQTVIITDSRFRPNQKANILQDCPRMGKNGMWLVQLYQEDNKTLDEINVLYISKDKVKPIETHKEYRYIVVLE